MHPARQLVPYVSGWWLDHPAEKYGSNWKFFPKQGHHLDFVHCGVTKLFSSPKTEVRSPHEIGIFGVFVLFEPIDKPMGFLRIFTYMQEWLILSMYM